MSDLFPIVLLTLLFFVAFAAAWGFGLWALSHMGGWAILARRFRFDSVFDGPSRTFQSAMMRWMINYGLCLTIGANNHGLFLDVLSIFRIGHPPLLIPWHEVEVSERRSLLGFRLAILQLGWEGKIPLRIGGDLADFLKRAAGSSWPGPAESTNQGFN